MAVRQPRDCRTVAASRESVAELLQRGALGRSVALTRGGRERIPLRPTRHRHRAPHLADRRVHGPRHADVDSVDFLRHEMDPAKSRVFRDARVQPLQVFTVDDFEKVLGLVCAGHDLVSMLLQRSSGRFRERDLGAWLHGDPTALSDKPRHPVLEARWGRMVDRAVEAIDLTIGLKADGS